MAPRRSFAPVSRSYGKLLRRAFADAGVEGGELLRAILARDADAAELTKASAGSLQASSQWPRKWVCKNLAGHTLVWHLGGIACPASAMSLMRPRPSSASAAG